MEHFIHQSIKKNIYSGVTYEITAREDIVTPEGTVWFHKGDVVDTFTTGDGITTSSLLQLGKYSIKETATQTGFVLDENSYDFDIEYAGRNDRCSGNQTGLYQRKTKVGFTDY